jgi:hypothetical protein
MSSSSRSSIPAGVPFLVVLVALCWEIPTASSFVPSLPPSLKWQSMTTTTTTTAATTTGRRSLYRSSGSDSRICLSNALNDDNEDDDDEDDEDDDEYIDTDSLGDWRNFRRTLSIVTDEDTQQDETSSTRKKSTVKEASSSSSVTNKNNNKNKNENEELLKSQNKELHQEYKSGVWAHETSTVSFIVFACA